MLKVVECPWSWRKVDFAKSVTILSYGPPVLHILDCTRPYKALHAARPFADANGKCRAGSR